MIDPHRNYSSDWWTPDEWLYWVQATLGCKPFDPCPRDWDGSGRTSGLERDWEHAVYCNPPGSNSSRGVKLWWQKAMEEMACKRTQDLVWCFFNYEAVFAVHPCPLELDGWMVMPSSRTGFIDSRTGRVMGSPRNRTWFWTTRPPARPTPTTCYIVPTGTREIVTMGAVA